MYCRAVVFVCCCCTLLAGVNVAGAASETGNSTTTDAPRATRQAHFNPTRTGYYGSNPYWQHQQQLGYDYPPSRGIPQYGRYFDDEHHEQSAESRSYYQPEELRSSYFSWNGKVPTQEAAGGGATFRQNLFGLSNINNAINPFAAFFARLPSTVIRNPDSGASLTNNYESCVDASGLSGICVRPLVCAGFGGRLASSCGLGTVCCVNTLAKCGGQITVNNTYWQSPTAVSSGSTCGVTLTLDSNLLEQKKKICQVRLDFLSFSVAQPNAQTVCATDTFQVGGANNKVPVICGENTGQHMYLNAPSSVTDMQLLFTFGSSTVSRLWNIKISLLPCGAKYLAPLDCLQYYTQTSGTVSSFNWKDTAGSAARQLANQDYKICFRTELVGNLVANKLCLSTCSLTNGGNAFSVSGTAANKPQATVAECNNDYLIVDGGYDPTKALTLPANTWDRYCGTAFNTDIAGTASATVCTTVKSFSLTYRTNGDETTATADTPDDPVTPTAGIGNIGFCLSFQQNS